MMGPGGFPGPCGEATDKETIMAEVGRYTGVNIGGSGKREGGVQDYGDLHSKNSEYVRVEGADVSRTTYQSER